MTDFEKDQQELRDAFENYTNACSDYRVALKRFTDATLKTIPLGYSFNWDALSEIRSSSLSSDDITNMYKKTGTTTISSHS